MHRNERPGQEGWDEAPPGQPAVDSDSGAIELLDNARGEEKKIGALGKKSYALVCVRAKAFLETIRDGALARLKRDELYAQLTEVVFAYWAARLHHPAALLDGKRERRIMARLREGAGDWGLLCYAIDGALADDWIMGRDVSSPRRYDGIECIFRDRAQVERLAEMCPKFRQGAPHPIVTKYAHAD